MSDPLQLHDAASPADLALPGSAELIPFPCGRFSIPPEDMADFGRLSANEQERVKFLLSLFPQMELGGIVKTSQRLGFQLRAMRGYSAGALKLAYYNWKDGGWKSLVRNYTNGCEKLPAEFVDHFRALCERNGRSMRQAMNALKRSWHSGEVVPGYGTWQQWFLTQWPERDLPTCCPGEPKGWGKSNLYVIQPTKAQRALKTKGFAAAKSFLPSLVRDTSQLLPLQLIAIDDFETDQLCWHFDPVSGVRGVFKMTGIVAMDVATRRIIGMILKPRLPNEQGKEQAITRAEVRFLLYQLLREYGVPIHGMTILCENASAAITTELELTFRNLFGGKVAVTRTNMISDKVLANGFVEKGGKPWLKGWIESGFNLMHNIAAVLAGQKGASYVVKPGELEEKIRLTERLIGTGRDEGTITTAQIPQAKIPFLSAAELHDAYLQIFAIMEHRTEHKMIGFDDVTEWRLHPSQPWMHQDAISQLTTEEMLQVQGIDRVRPRKESPRERWAKLMPLVKCHVVPEHVLMMLLLTPKKAKLAGHKLTFTHSKVGYTFAVDPRSAIAQERQGAELLCYFDPTRPQHAHVCKLDGRLLGEVQRFGPVDIADQAAVTEAERMLGELYNSVVASVRARPLHQEEDRQLAQDKAVNDALVLEAAALRNAKGVTATLARRVEQTADAITANANNVAQEIANLEKEHAALKNLRKTQASLRTSVHQSGTSLADLVQADEAPTPVLAPIDSDDEGHDEPAGIDDI